VGDGVGPLDRADAGRGDRPEAGVREQRTGAVEVALVEQFGVAEHDVGDGLHGVSHGLPSVGRHRLARGPGRSVAPMTPPAWFRARRYGLSVQLGIATVPAFAPVGQEAGSYDELRSWMPELQARHRERHPDVVTSDDFLPALTLEHLDAGSIARLAVEAGAGYLLAVSRSADGFCWWDAAGTDRTSARLGPKRDVVAELHGAAAAHDLVLGLIHRPDGGSDIAELVDRFRPAMLLAGGDGDPDIVAAYRSAMAGLGLPSMVDDRWPVADPDLATHDHLPAVTPTGPWQLRRSLSHSFGYNEAERASDHLTATAIVDLLTEVVARGGNLVLNVAPRADGTLPDEQTGPLLEAGRWVRANADVVGSGPFDVWGDGELRYTRSPGGDVQIVDLRSLPRRSIAHFSPHRYPVEAVTGAASWSQDEHGLHLEAAPGSGGDLATVYRVRLRARSRITLAVRGELGPGPVTIGPARFGTVGAGLAAASAGDVVRLGPGRHGVDTERFPLVVPAGVTLSGAGASTVLDGGRRPAGTPIVALDGAGSALEQASLAGSPAPDDDATTAVTATGDRVRIERCEVEGSIEVAGGWGVEVAWNVVSRGGIRLAGTDRASVTGNRQGDARTEVGIHIVGGAGHRVEANTLAGSRCGIRLERCRDASVSANQVAGRWWAVHLQDGDGCRVTGNRVTGMRAFTVTGGTGNELAANVADGTDTGVLLEHGADGTVVTGNHLTGCRVAVLTWDDRRSTVDGNLVTGSREHDRVEGP
jgi:alpha-L-fucosidase